MKRLLASVSCAAVVATGLIVAPVAVADIETPELEIVRPMSPYIDMPDSYPIQPTLDVFPDLETDASIDRGTIPYDEIAPFINNLMATSDRVSAQVVGKSDQGRDVYMVTVTSPETAAETAQQLEWRDTIKYDAESALADEALQAGYKTPIWFNGNIHGNEWEGTDATLNYIEELATSDDPAVADLVSANRLYFTVTNNPDGRALGQRATATGYDANRDFVTGATAESAIVRDLASIIQPTYFIDIHGYTSVLQIEPCGPPHGESYEYDLFLPHAYATALEIEEAVVTADIEGNTYLGADGRPTEENTGKIKIPYRDIREGWDDWPPIFAPQYVAFQGAITNTVELPLGRDRDSTNPINAERAVINIEVAEIVINTVVDYVGENRDALLDNQIEIFRRGVAGEPSVEIPADITEADLAEGVPTEWVEIWDETDVYTADFPRAYVIPMGDSQRSESDAQTLVQQLLVNNIDVSKTTEEFSFDGVTYPAGSYYVDMHQPLRGLANALLDEGTDITDRIGRMYDISAWSLALLWGADVDVLGTTTDAAPTTALEMITEAELTGSVPAAGTYLAFEPRGVADYVAINELLEEGIALSQIPDGTVIVGNDEASYAAAASAAALFGVDFTANDGRALRDGESTALSSVRIGYASNSDDRDALTKLGFDDIVPVTTGTITSGEVDLTEIDLLFVGSNLNFNSTSQADGIAAVEAYIAEGKPVVGLESAGATFVNAFGIAAVSSVSGASGSNGIASVDTVADGVLGDYPQDTAFGYPFVWFTELGENTTVEQTYATEDPFISGHWSAATSGRAQSDAAAQPAAFSAVGESGSRAFVLGSSPTFRNHPVGAFSDVARAIFWAAAEGESVTPPGAVIEEDLTDETRGTVSIPDSAEPGETIPVTMGEGGDGTVSVLMFSDPIELGEFEVVGGEFEVMIPADAALGEHKIAVVDDQGALLGWDDLSVATAVVEPTPTAEPTASATASATPIATETPATASSGDSGDLAVTGGGDTSRLVLGAMSILLLGAGIAMLARARTARQI
ncbi:M14 family zinc carboxypeptidase [Microbacterium marmarense]|uniref:M14 family zinc carboxypeptidase n=1 Tax=Microbacterium marmarense TaxID=3122051 RepID=A0ABU8LPP1_9MICO